MVPCDWFWLMNLTCTYAWVWTLPFCCFYYYMYMRYGYIGQLQHPTCICIPACIHMYKCTCMYMVINPYICRFPKQRIDMSLWWPCRTCTLLTMNIKQTYFAKSIPFLRTSPKLSISPEVLKDSPVTREIHCKTSVARDASNLSMFWKEIQSRVCFFVNEKKTFTSFLHSFMLIDWLTVLLQSRFLNFSKGTENSIICLKTTC